MTRAATLPTQPAGLVISALFLERTTTPSVHRAKDRGANGRLILIVERDHGVRDLQEHFLAEAGYSVEFVDDGEAALEQVRANPPLLVVTEILIPKIDGLTLCRRLRDEPATSAIPVIVFSILAASARAAEAGAQAFLRKPLVGSTFLAAVKDLIGEEQAAGLEGPWVSP